MKKLFKKDYKTNYIVYTNTPYDDPNGYRSSLFNNSKEFDSLEEAKKYAKDTARYYKCFITEVRPIFLFDNDVKEHSL